jgi:hypothetical protein
MRSQLAIAGAAVSVSLASAVRAHSITDEILLNSTQSTSANPRTGSVGDSLHLNLDLSPKFVLALGAIGTYEGQTPDTGRDFGTSAAKVAVLSAGLELLPAESWAVGATFSGSPPSTVLAGTFFTGPNDAGQLVPVHALVESRTSELSGTLDVSYDTAGFSNLEWSFIGSVSFTHLDASQRITEARIANQARILLPADISGICDRNGPRCLKGLKTALVETPANLDSERLSGSATATVEHDTDLTLSFDWYHYEEDPAEIGFFSLVEAGRAGLGSPIAPLQWMVRPEVQERFGDLSARIWLSVGRYEPGTGGSSAGIGLRLQYRVSRAVRLWATASGQRDIDVDGEATRSGGLALGAGYRF